jgi:hypothetical protein
MTEHRERILDAFESSGMSGQAFAIHHGIKVQTFASWMQKRRRIRSEYDDEAGFRMPRSSPDMIGRPSDTPGKRSDTVGRQTDMIGRPSDTVGKRSDTPGKGSDMPGRLSDTPGKRSDMPGRSSDTVGKRTDMPGNPIQPPGKPSSGSAIEGRGGISRPRLHAAPSHPKQPHPLHLHVRPSAAKP